MAQVVKILPHGPSQSRPYKSYTVNTIAADDTATQGARAPIQYKDDILSV